MEKWVPPSTVSVDCFQASQPLLPYHAAVFQVSPCLPVKDHIAVNQIGTTQ